MGIAEGMKGITENILASYDNRVKTISDLVAATRRVVADARKTIKAFTSDRKKMSAEQAENLSNFAKDLVKNVSELVKGFAKNRQRMSEEQAKNLAEFVKNIIKEVNSKLKDFQKQRRETSEELKKRLNKEIKEIQNWVKDTVKNTQTLIAEYRQDMDKARRTWQGMASTVAKFKKEGIMPKIEAGEKVTTVEEAVKKPKKKGRKKKSR